MDTQTAYEAIRAYFTKPGAVFSYVPRVDPNDHSTRGRCVYYGEIDGKPCHCAFGCLIPPALYDTSFEGTTVDGLFNRTNKSARLLAEAFAGVDVNFLVDAQNIHDTRALQGGSIEEFIVELDATAHHRKLTVVTT